MHSIATPSVLQASRRCHEHGASLVEFSVVGLSVILAGLFNLQLVLLYHANLTVNYATFEAARAGAVSNASLSAIRNELGIRLAPLQGGDGSQERAFSAIAQASLKVIDPLNTSVLIVNPTREAFDDWGIKDPDTGELFIPVNQLRHQDYAVGQHSGLSLRDANLLKLQVTHGVDLRVPVVGKLMTGPMQWLDHKNAAYYLRGRWPIQSVATVRMQSDSLKSGIFKDSTTGNSPTTGEDGSNSNSNGDSTGGSNNESEADHTGSSDPSFSKPDGTTPAPPAATDCPEGLGNTLQTTDMSRVQAYGDSLLSTSAFRTLLAKRDAPAQKATGF